MIVVAGRDEPRWADADKYELNSKIPARYVYLKSVDNLAAVDAADYLRKAGVVDEVLRESLIRYASVEKGEVHPLHLGLCADVVLEAQGQGTALTPGDFSEVQAFQEKSAYLIRQLLKYVDRDLEYAIRALGACRAFNFEIYRLLGERLSFTADKPAFTRLVDFSFVRQVAQKGAGWYRIHDLLRRLDSTPEANEAHKILTEHYQALAELDAIYHVNQLNRTKGVNMWVATLNAMLDVGRYELCRALLEIRKELSIESDSDLGAVCNAEGHYYQALSFYEAAGEAYVKAIASYDRALSIYPYSTIELNEKGISLQSLASLLSSLSNYRHATARYIDSLQAFEAVLQQDPTHLEALNNKGISLKNLGNVQSVLHMREAALESYFGSIEAFDTALKQDPNDVEVLSNMGIALQKLADLQVAESCYEFARTSYVSSINFLDSALKKAPYYTQPFNRAGALNNMGNSFQSLADLHVLLSEYNEAQATYVGSVDIFDVALQRAPDYLPALSNKGISLQRLADLQVKLFNPQQADINYDIAISIYDTVIQHAPNHVEAIYNKGVALKMLCILRFQQSRNKEAMSILQKALEMFAKSVVLSPDNPVIREQYEYLAQLLTQEGD